MMPIGPKTSCCLRSRAPVLPSIWDFLRRHCGEALLPRFRALRADFRRLHVYCARSRRRAFFLRPSVRKGTAPVYLGTQIAARDDDDYRSSPSSASRHVCADPPAIRTTGRSTTSSGIATRCGSSASSSTWCSCRCRSRPIEKSQSPDILLAGPNRDRADRFDLPADRAPRRGRHPARSTTSTSSASRAPSRSPAAAARGTSTFRWDKMRPGRPARPRRRARRGRELGAHRLFPRARRAGRRQRTRSASPAIRTIPTRRRAIAASRACSARSRG